MSMNLVFLILITPSRSKAIMFSETTRPVGRTIGCCIDAVDQVDSGDFCLTHIKVCSDRLLQRLTRVLARFFDTTPIGRILNHSTMDINTIDRALQTSACATLLGILNFLASFTVIIVVIPALAPFALVIA